MRRNGGAPVPIWPGGPSGKEMLEAERERGRERERVRAHERALFQGV
jgi:hypothetical protein